MIYGGRFRNYKNFTFMRVYDAGHMVPMDQPANALKMINEFMDKGVLEELVV